jgi:type II secretory pathway pseudopilin PulG
MHKYSKRSFTLIELIVATTILIIIAGVVVYPLIRFYELWMYSTYRMEILWGERQAAQEIAKNIRQVRSDTSVYTAAPAQFEFDVEDINGNVIRINYKFLNNKLYRNDVAFMDKVEEFNFTYYKIGIDGITFEPIAVPRVNPQETDIRFVEINLTLKSGDESISTKTMVRCRNLN